MGKVRSPLALGAAIRSARGREKLDAVAGKAGLSTSALSRLERGERSEGLDLLFRVLDAVGLELAAMPRAGAAQRMTAAEAVEDALAADPELYEHSRDVILAAYHRARQSDASPGRQKKVAAGSSR